MDIKIDDYINCTSCYGKLKDNYFRVFDEYFHDNNYCLLQAYSYEEYRKLFIEEIEINKYSSEVYWSTFKD